MTSASVLPDPDLAAARQSPAGALGRQLVIGLIGFLTLVDLFATQAILPSLARRYLVAPAVMGSVVNACTFGMAAAGLVVALISRRLDRRRGIWICLLLLAIPTSLLASMPDLATFTALRVVQGILMAAAFSLTMAYLAERCSAADTAGALAAYVTGVVAANLFGRLLAAAVAGGFGLEANFYLFALLNLAGALLVLVSLQRTQPMAAAGPAAASPFASWLAHLRNRPLRATFGIGFIILFAFIGTFTYVNFVLVRPPLALGPMTLGLVYLVFLPALLTTPLAGAIAGRFGTRPSLTAGLLLALLGLPLLLLPSLAAVLLGLVLVGVGTFFAQATATGFVSRAATIERGAASGLYLASYYLGGLIGSFLLGQVFDQLGWPACVGVIGLSLLLAAWLATQLRLPATAG